MSDVGGEQPPVSIQTFRAKKQGQPTPSAEASHASGQQSQTGDGRIGRPVVPIEEKLAQKAANPSNQPESSAEPSDPASKISMLPTSQSTYDQLRAEAQQRAADPTHWTNEYTIVPDHPPVNLAAERVLKARKEMIEKAKKELAERAANEEPDY